MSKIIWLCEQEEFHNGTLSEANNYYTLHEMPTLEISQSWALHGLYWALRVLQLALRFLWTCSFEESSLLYSLALVHVTETMATVQLGTKTIIRLEEPREMLLRS